MRRRHDLDILGPISGYSRAVKGKVAYLNSICFNMVIAVTTRGFRPVESECSSILDEIMAVVNSVSAAVPAPQHRIDSEM